MSSLESEAAAAFFSAAAAAILLWIAARKGFFIGWKGVQRTLTPPTFLLVLGAFLIYFLISWAISFFFTRWQLMAAPIYSVEFASLVTCLTGSAIIAAFALYLRTIYHPISLCILHASHKVDWKNDCLIALTACLITFPLIICVGQILEILVFLIFHTLQIPDQSIILFLKTTFGKPLYFFLAAFSIVIWAPMIEELIFRGFLQSYLRRYLNAPIAIILSSAFFALFHYSSDQGLGNIPIIGSLFILALFLGFVYERQGSLLPPIIFHATFNTLSIANLYFLGT